MGRGIGPGACIDDFGKAFGRQDADPAAFPAQPVDGLVAHDPADPARRRAVTGIPVRILPDMQEGFVHGIFCCRHVARQDSLRLCDEAALHGGVKLFECALATFGDLLQTDAAVHVVSPFSPSA